MIIGGGSRGAVGRPRLAQKRSLVVSVALAIAPVAGLSACGDDGGGGGDGGSKGITIAGTPLSTADILLSTALDEGLGEKAGIDLDFERAANVTVLYQDFTAGRYDCIFTDPAVFAEQASQGLPVTIVAATSPNFSYLIARKDSDIKDPGDLVGKRLVAATATGGYKVFTAEAQEWYDANLAEDVEVVQATTDADGLAQIAAGSADAMFTFETSVTKSLMTDPDVDVVYAPATDYEERTGETLWQNVIMCRTDHDIDPETADKLVDVVGQVAESVTADPQAADDFAVKNLKADPGVYAEAFTSGRLSFAVSPINDENQGEMENMIKFQQDVGTMNDFDLPEDYFNGID